LGERQGIGSIGKGGWGIVVRLQKNAVYSGGYRGAR